MDPFVVLSILDHHMRRPEEAEHVSGFLIGSKGKGVMRVSNFVPTLKDSTFIELTLRTCPGQSAIGWYTTNPTLEDERDRLGGMQVFLAVHTPDEAHPSIAVRAFELERLVVGGHDIRSFRPVACTVAATSAPGSVAVDTIVRTLFPDVADASDPSAVPSVAIAPKPAAGAAAAAVASTSSGVNSDVFVEFQQLRRNLKTASDYCARAAEGKIAGDPELGRKLSATLLADLSVLSASSSLDADIETTTQDSLMLSYVMKLLARKVTELRRTYHEQLESLVSEEQ